MQSLLRDPLRCQFVPVTIAEPLAVSVTLALFEDLRSRKIPVSDVIVNRLHLAGGCPACSAAASAEEFQIQRLLDGMAVRWFSGLGSGAVRRRGSGTGAVGCNSGSAHVRFLPTAAKAPSNRASRLRATANRAASGRARVSRMRFVLFAGKGGVGKTTLSCAPPCGWPAIYPDKRILLFSTDPAHSLSPCLQAKIGPRPTVLFGNLTAIEIDPRAEFGKLKARYAEDLERFLDTVSRGFDLTFDRVVLEKMMDLAPPGLDEIMALTRILDFLARDSTIFSFWIARPPAT
jgi:arsenite-transporting ATPase